MSPLLVLIVAVLATTYAGPIVRFATAPALAIAFWRLALVLPLTMLSGLLLALHFWSWIASLRFTTVLLALTRHTPLVGFPRRDWAVFGAMAAGPMLVGHTGMNYALRHFRATTVNVAALGEPVGATLLAWLIPAIHEVPRATALGGGLLVLMGIGLSLGAGSRDESGHAR